LSDDIVHVEKSGRFDVDVVFKSLFMRLGELSDESKKSAVPVIQHTTYNILNELSLLPNFIPIL
jgi:hypothetical protein